MPKNKKDTEKLQITFSRGQLELIRKYKGVFGEKDTEIIRFIVANWLLEKQEKDKEV